MKKIKVLFMLAFLIALTACGQQKKYVSYTVKKGETIKSIAKDNGVKTRDLLRLNPDVSRKPAPNTVIIIPNTKTATTTVTATSDKKIHTVKRKETLFSISQKYGITVVDLKKANNLIGDNVSIGRELVIPKPSKEVVVEKDEEVVVEEVVVEEVGVETEESPKAVFHTVEKGDTVFNLSKRFNISEETLLQMNPTILDVADDLKIGMIIKVGEAPLEGVLDKYFVDTITAKPLNVVLMLPYKLNSETDYQAKFNKKTSLLNIVTDFHLGVLTAIDSLKNQGLAISLKVFDTENSSSKLTKILNGNNFENTNIVIGPLFLKNTKVVAKELNGIPVFLPMLSKNQAKITENSLVKISPNKTMLEQKLLNYLLNNYNGENIVVAGDDSSKSVAKISQIVQKLKSHDSINKITVIKPEKGYIKKERFEKAIDTTFHQKNWVILVGKDNVTTNDVVNNLGVMTKEKANIQLFSFDKGANFVNVSNNQLARLRFTYPKANFVDDFDEATNVFKKKFKSKYYAYPSKYAIKGFDVTYDALLRLANFDSFKDASKAGISKRIGAKFEYDNKPFRGVENKGVFLIQYQEDLKLKALE